MKTTHACLMKMCDNAQLAQRMYIELGMIDQACRYGLIWCRIMKAANQKAYDECFGGLKEWKGLEI